MGEEAELEAFVSVLVTRPIPTKADLPLPAPVQRYWRAGETGTPQAEILRRHPELESPFGDLPAFKVHRHKRGFGWGVRKAFNSFVMDREVFAHSSLEFDALKVYELDGSVLEYIEQPVVIAYWMNGRRRFYRPDILLVRASGLEFVEVKYEKDAGESEDKWEAVGRGLSAAGHSFRVVTEKDVRRRPLFANMRAVYLARHMRPERATAKAVLLELARLGSMKLGEFERFGLTNRNVLALVRYGLLSVDLSTSVLQQDTTVLPSTRCRRNPWQIRQ